MKCAHDLGMTVGFLRSSPHGGHLGDMLPLWKFWSSHPSSRSSATASSCRDGNLDIAGGMAAEEGVTCVSAGAAITGYL